MKFTRRQVLNAIRFENLKPGSFVSTDDNNNKICNVCAVGGVLRRKGWSAQRIGNFSDKLIMKGRYLPDDCLGPVEDQILDALESKNYLSALSLKFEYLAEEFGVGKRTRQRLAVFVKDNFPKEFRSVD